MAENFHKHISKAFQSKTKRKETESKELSHPEDNESNELESRLDKILASSSNKSSKEETIQEKASGEEVITEMKTLFHACENITQSISEFFDKLNQTSSSEEVRHLKENYEQRIYSEEYLNIKKHLSTLLSQGTYSQQDEFIIKLLNYVKTSVMLLPHENLAIIKFLLANDSLLKPYTFADILEICTQLKTIVKLSSSLEIQKDTRFIIYLLMINATSMQQEEECKKLDNVDMTDLKNKSLQLIENSPQLIEALRTNVKQSENNKNIRITQDELHQLSQNINDYQNLLHQYAKERIQFIVTNDVSQIKQLHHLHLKLMHHFTLANDVLTIEKRLQSLSNDFPENMQEQVAEISKNLTSLTKSLDETQQSLSNLGHEKFDSKFTLLTHLVNGTFFNEKEHDKLHAATYTFHSIFNPIELLNGIIRYFTQYASSSQKECLLFLKSFLMLDTNNAFIPGIDKKNEFIDKIEMICEQALLFASDNQSIIDLTQEISDIIANKITNKRNAFVAYLNEITTGKISNSMLIRTINTINHNFAKKKPDPIAIDECCAIVNAILASPNFISNDIEHNMSLEEGIEKFCLKLEHIAEYQPQASFVRKNLKDNDKQTKLPSSSDSSMQPFTHYELTQLFADIAHNKMSVMEYEKSLENFVTAFRLDFTALFSQVDLSELRDLAWKKDKVGISNGLLPQAPSVRKFYQHHYLLVKFFTLSILNEFGSGKFVPRESIFEVKRIHEFVERAILVAIDHGAVSTMITLELALRNSAIARLNLSKPEQLALRSKYFDDLKTTQDLLGKLMQEKDSIPFLPLALKDMTIEYTKKYPNEFEKRVCIGKKMSVMNEKIQTAKSRNTKLSDIGKQITYLMQNNQLTSPSILTDDILLNEDRVHDLANNASEYIKPKEFKSYNIHSFESLAELKKHLIYCQKRMKDFHLSEKNPEKSIIEYMLQSIKNDSNMVHFQDSLQILDLIGQINLSQSREYKNYESYLAQILSAYQDKAAALLKGKQLEHSNTLAHFFSIYTKYHKIKDFRENQVTTLNPFSAKRHLKEVIAALDKYLRYYKKLLAMSKEREVQKTYSELLTKVLTGDKQDPVIHFGPAQQVETQTQTSLLPDTEFPVPQAEPEHPDYIGINRTMNFNPDTLQRSIFELFETYELKNDFRSAFPWSADIDCIYKLENSVADPTLNLLITDQLVAPEIQIAVIDFILLSLDILGKIAGFNGDLTIRNFTTIKNVTDGLQEITDLLSIPLFDEEKFRTHLNEMTLSLSDLNQDLLEMINSRDPLCPAQENTAMSEFCHLNEHLTHQLMGIPYEKSMLSPLSSDSPVFSKMSESLKRELLQKATSVSSGLPDDK